MEYIFLPLNFKIHFYNEIFQKAFQYFSKLNTNNNFLLIFNHMNVLFLNKYNKYNRIW